MFNKFIEGVFNLRYLTVFAVVMPMFGAALMLLYGTLDTVNAYRIFFGFEEPEGAVAAGEGAMIKLVASLDHFVFATILMVFAAGLYTLFFRTSVGGQGDETTLRPSWSQLKNLGGIDEMLLKVIIMLLAVSFLEYVLTTGMGSLNWSILIVPLTIVGLSIAVRWMNEIAAQDDE